MSGLLGVYAAAALLIAFGLVVIWSDRRTKHREHHVH